MRVLQHLVNAVAVLAQEPPVVAQNDARLAAVEAEGAEGTLEPARLVGWRWGGRSRRLIGLTREILRSELRMQLADERAQRRKEQLAGLKGRVDQFAGAVAKGIDALLDSDSEDDD